MTLEENKALVRRYFEDAPYNPDACLEIFAPSFQFHAIVHTGMSPQVVECTPENEKAVYARHKAVWGGWHLAVEEMIAEGDRVMVRWTSHGTHQAESHGLPPTYKKVTNSGINIFRIADGKIAEVWDIYDRLWIWQQLGVLPEIKEAIAKAREVFMLDESNASEPAKIECITLSGQKKKIRKDRLILYPAAYAIVVHNGKVLLMTMRHTGKYHLPGGSIDVGERLEDALKRELQEETGIEIDVKRLAHFEELFFYYDPSDRAYHGLFFFLHLPSQWLGIVT